ncbi:hypothetical protein ACFXK0_00675 [Nocardia sp. NPDC059177]|uniref:hypothetical protein n=1 Tax=Nocardia sp. NPDC059177 TaxID=3346759 RepID=UPI0036C4F3F0
MPVGLIRRQSYELAIDYGQFYLFAATSSDLELTDIVDMAIEHGRFASDGSNFVVLSPISYDPKMKLTVELWSAPPPNDRDNWAVAFESEIAVGENENISISSAAGLDYLNFYAPSGRYNVDVVGSIDSARAPSVRSTGCWRVRLWP